MTLLLSIANQEYAMVLADRRITSNGRTIDDEFNKLCVLFCDDARMAVTYTGLATYQDFNTSDWLCNTLADIGVQTGAIHDIIREISLRLADELEKRSLHKQKLTVLFSGFVFWAATPEARTYDLSNWEPDGKLEDSFSLSMIAPQDNCIVSVAGVGVALDPLVERRLKELLVSDLRPRQLLRYCIKQMQAAAKSNKSQGLIGEQINTAIVPAGRDTVVYATFHSSKFVNYYFGPNIVITKGPTVHGSLVQTNAILAGPEIRKKSACWCGSGLIFKDCHLKKFGSALLRHGSFRAPLSPVVRFEEETARPSGKVFFVSGGFS